MNGFLLWIAQGCGLGRMPAGPGTFGSVAGLAWFALLLLPGNPAFFICGAAAGLGFSVWISGRAEAALGQKDPSSVVVDEIAAMPLCFAAWLGIAAGKSGLFPSPAYFASRWAWPLVVAVFAAFRCFDIWKPWPIRQSQSLPRGWGITVDDALAAVYVNAAVLVVYEARQLL